MYVLAQHLDPADLATLQDVCTDVGVTLRESVPDADDSDVLLAEVHAFDPDAGTAPPARPRAGEPFRVAVLPSISATKVLSVLSTGFSFALATPLRQPRVLGMLDYLKSSVPPESAQLVLLGADHSISIGGAASVAGSAPEANLLRCLADRPGQIVPRTDIEAVLDGEDVNRVVSVVRDKLLQVGSGAKILKVPHLGFRLAGTVREVDSR